METKKLSRNKVDFVIYHDPCADGCGSAWVAWKYLTKYCPEKEVVYYGTNHGSSPPDVEGRNVLIVDFSYKKEVLLEMTAKAENLLVIDHHISAKKELVAIPDRYKIFDMTHSGAIMTWNYFFPGLEPPMMLKYIEDRDIWKKEFPDVDAFAAWFYTLPYEFEVYDQYSDDTSFLRNVKTIGRHYLSLNLYNIKQTSSYATIKFTRIGNKYYFVAYVNSTILKSDIGNHIFDLLPLIDFSAIYSIVDKYDSTIFSLRSTDKHADVSKIATSLGGGGHRNASGVSVSGVSNKLPGVSYDHGEIYNQLGNVYFSGLKIDTKRSLNVIYMNSSMCQWELARYLLQTKYVNGDGKNVQNAMSIYNYLENNDTFVPFEIAVVVEHNNRDNTTCFTVCFDESLPSDVKSRISTALECDFSRPVKVPGIQKYLKQPF